MQKKVEGIIFSTVDYKESSKIINIFTKEELIICKIRLFFTCDLFRII